MNLNMDELMHHIMNDISDFEYIKSSDIPNIELYMDQVTTFIDSQLASSKRFEQDKILTKTMINNYAKNHLLPAPHKKKYSKEHVLMLIFIYYFKSFLSISDIQALLNPLSEKYFQNTDGLNIEELYNEICTMEKHQLDDMKSDILNKIRISRETFKEASDDDRDFLQLYSLICLLSFDVYYKKQVIESIIDSIQED